MRENADQNNFLYGHFSRSDMQSKSLNQFLCNRDLVMKEKISETNIKFKLTVIRQPPQTRFGKESIFFIVITTTTA